MGFFGRPRQQEITREQAMAARPLRHPGIETTRDAKGEVSLTIPRRRTAWVNFLAKMGVVPESRIVTLDAVGTKVWDLCDGEHAVKDIVAFMASEHQLSRKEAEISLVAFLRGLVARGYVALMIEEKKPQGPR
jgi:hypothetical protein